MIPRIVIFLIRSVPQNIHDLKKVGEQWLSALDMLVTAGIYGHFSKFHEITVFTQKNSPGSPTCVQLRKCHIIFALTWFCNQHVSIITDKNCKNPFIPTKNQKLARKYSFSLLVITMLPHNIYDNYRHESFGMIFYGPAPTILKWSIKWNQNKKFINP